MEARALYEFRPTADDELGFQQNDTIQILSFEDGQWLRAENHGQIGFVPSTYIEVQPHTLVFIWYIFRGT